MATTRQRLSWLPALEYGVGTIVVDNLEELEMLDRLAAAKNICQEIMLRVKPGVDAHTHNFIRTGQIDSKFGFALEIGEAMAAVKKAVSCPPYYIDGSALSYRIPNF